MTSQQKDYVKTLYDAIKNNKQIYYVPARGTSLYNMILNSIVIIVIGQEEGLVRCTQEKPPLGVMPRDIWGRKRQEDIASAMERYLEAGKKIPKEWLYEYNEISDRQETEYKTLCDEYALQNKDCGCDCTREFVKKENTNE